MNQFLSLLISVLVFSSASAETIKDWVIEKGVNTLLDKKGCVAQTSFNIDGTDEKWTLQVVKLETGDGDYTHPMIISFPEQEPSNEYYEASGLSVGKKSETKFSLTLLQPASGDKTIVAARLKDRLKIIRKLKSDDSFTVNYLAKEGATQTARFSLSGSSKAISALETSCR